MLPGISLEVTVAQLSIYAHPVCRTIQKEITFKNKKPPIDSSRSKPDYTYGKSSRKEKRRKLAMCLRDNIQK